MGKRLEDNVVEFDAVALADYSTELCFLPCLTEWDICVLLSMLRTGDFESRWRLTEESNSGPVSRYLRDVPGQEQTLTDALASIELIKVKLIMAMCGQEIKEGLEAIAAAIAGQNYRSVITQNCGSGTGTGGTGIIGTTPGGNISYGDNPGLEVVEDEAEPVPDGFESWSEYFTYKCQVANHIADGIILSLRNISALSLLNLTALSVLLGLALGSFIIFPPSAIPVMIAALLAIATIQGVLYLIGDYFEEHREEMVCAFYTSESAVAAQDALIGLLDEALSALVVASEMHPYIRTIALVLASTDTLNQLFDGTLRVDYPDADCSSCEEGPYLITVYNSAAEVIDTINWDGTETSFFVNYTIGGDYSPFYFYIKDLEDNWICSDWTIITFTHMSGMQQNAGCGQGGAFSNVSGSGPHTGEAGRLFGLPIGGQGTAEISVVLH